MRTHTAVTDGKATHAHPTRAAKVGATFAWVYLLLAGALSVIYGLAAVMNRDYFNEGDLLWSNLTAWGVVAMACGGVQILLAYLVFRHKLAGVIGGMAVALFAFISNFLAIGAYPAWSIIAMVVNGYVIWALPRALDETS